MNCADFESKLADYLDGTLDPGEGAALEQHVSSCAACQEFMGEVKSAVSLLQRVPEVEPPATLITRIAYQIPRGRSREPFERQGYWSAVVSKWLQPVLQPRLVMGMAMTVLSFAMLERCTGVKVQRIQPADLNPSRVWGGVEERTVRVKDRMLKYYENLRVVYEVEARLKDMEQQQEALQDTTPAPADGKKPAAPAKGEKK